MSQSQDRPARTPRAPGAGAGSSGRPPRSGQPPRAGTAGRGAAPGAGRSGAAPRGGATREEIAQREYDPRREARRKAIRVPLPDDVDPRDLDADARRELRSLTKETAELVAQHLVMTGRLLDDDPQQALAHARAARALAGRVGVVREGAGLAAYAAGEWSEALSELRAARRITGGPEHLAVFADCERGLGRPERALAYGDDPQVAQLTQDQRVELVIVLAGARRDMGQPEAAVVSLQDPARRTTERRPWAARLWYAYADALLAAGREADAREWFGKAAAVDVDGETDAGDRLLALEGVVLEDGLATDGEQDEPLRADLPTDAELAELVQGIPPLAAGTPVFASEARAVSEAPAEVVPAPQQEAAPSPPPGPVAPPPFAAPPAGSTDGTADELRLFD